MAVALTHDGLSFSKNSNGKMLKIADLVDDDRCQTRQSICRAKVPEAKNNRDHVDIIIALGYGEGRL